MGKQFAKMWEKAIDQFQEKLKEQGELASQRSRSERGRSRSASEISKKSLSRINEKSKSNGAVMSGNDFSAIADRRSKSPTVDLISSPAGFDLSNKNPNAANKEIGLVEKAIMKKNQTTEAAEKNKV